MSSATSVAIAAVVKSIVVNCFLATVKITTGALGNSYALVADGIESINDVIASVVVMVSLKMSSKPADEDHPFGHGKAERLGALFVIAAGRRRFDRLAERS